MASRRILMIVALGAWISCTGAPASDSDTDPDASAHDSGADASRPDSGRDAPALDASDAVVAPDTSFDAGSPGWVSIAAGLPDYCYLERADHPEALVQFRIHMAPCPGRANCELSDTLSLDGTRVQWVASDGTYALGYADPYLDQTWYFLSPLDGGPTIAAYRGGPTHGAGPFCAVAFGALAEGRLGFGVSYDDRAGSAGGAIYVGELDDASGIDAPLINDTTFFDVAFPQALWVASTAVVVWTPTGLVDVSTGAIRLLRDPSDPHSYGSSPTSVVGSDILFADYGTTQHITLAHAAMMGGVAYYHPAPTNEVEVALTDGHDVAWVEGALGTTTPVFELWTAPFVEDPADLAPRMLREIDVWADPMLGDGIWATTRRRGSPPTQTFEMELYDLSDGRHRTWDEMDLSDRNIRYVSAHAVIYTHHPLDGEHLVRFDPSRIPYEP